MAGRVERIIHLLPRVGWLPSPQERLVRLQKGHRDIGGPFRDLRQQCLGVSDMLWDGISGYVFYLVVGERNRKWLAGSWARCDGGRVNGAVD